MKPSYVQRMAVIIQMTGLDNSDLVIVILVPGGWFV